MTDRPRDRGLSGSLCWEQCVFLAPSRNSTKGQTVISGISCFLVAVCALRRPPLVGEPPKESAFICVYRRGVSETSWPDTADGRIWTKLGIGSDPKGPQEGSFSLRPPRISAPLRFNLTFGLAEIAVGAGLLNVARST